ncbi:MULTISPECIES: LysR substrate-binding domain-containing protein [unclassified Thalassotalea]|uniref:LysR substrate-binding domain-containing protein n=1 Tax=unclassified Thalassotalea TaxID=2614972 RepID=UPI001082154C|nr:MULTISPECIES: LysR substrate-binding domain-containing protein [unclassified Thalassotalea]NMP15617.1 LysR family transcriptional regulator [Thalassotalea sp. Y01]QBY05737.1 LysR family transcriptional regulator [Thalassotalea sp. HSM 43]
MARKLPPLHLLQIFEVAARLQSFKQASEELFITPSAVSHQIKALEEFLGFELFIRKTRKVSLNNAGRSYLKTVQDALYTIEQGTAEITRQFQSPVLRISTFPTMASNVIIPQLGLFQKAHPDIDIRIETGMQLADLRYSDFDIAIRIGKGGWPGVLSQKLMNVDIAAVCSPEFQQQHDLRKLEQLSDVPLLDLGNMDNIWSTWMGYLGVDRFKAKTQLSFNNYDTMLDAAEQGLGVALAMVPIENRLIERKLLVNPFEIVTPYTNALYAVYRPEDEERHEIHCFLSWLTKSPLLQQQVKNTKKTST